MASIPSDETLLDYARKGDQNAFRELVERHQHAVVRTVASMLGPGPDVDDVVQEVFIRFYKTLGQFRGDATCKTYLTRIAINRSLDALRRRKRQRTRFVSRDNQTVSLLEQGANDPRSERFDQMQLIHSAMNRLKPHHRAVIVLRLIDGYSTEETAQILGIAQGTVLSRLNRATVRLRSILSPILEESIHERD